MARTRAATARLVKTEGTGAQFLHKRQSDLKQADHATTAEANTKTDDDEEEPPSTFNGKLQHFQYGTTTSTTSSGSDGAPAASATTTTSRHTLKRTLEQSIGVADSAVKSSSPAKKRRTPSKYAPPSKYAHLSVLKDILEPNLICVFVGTNPGVRTASAGHAYAHPSNLFWKLLYASGCTDRRLRPEEDVDLPQLYSMGNTNIVERPTKDAAELSKEEMAGGTPILDAKFRKYKPEAVCIVGKGIWEAIWRYRYGRAPKASEFKYGWQDEKENMGKSDVEELDGDGNIWRGARVFVTTSTSGLSASTTPAEKEAIWKPFGDWVKDTRAKRLATKAT